MLASSLVGSEEKRADGWWGRLCASEAHGHIVGRRVERSGGPRRGRVTCSGGLGSAHVGAGLSGLTATVSSVLVCLVVSGIRVAEVVRALGVVGVSVIAESERDVLLRRCVVGSGMLSRPLGVFGGLPCTSCVSTGLRFH